MITTQALIFSLTTALLFAMYGLLSRVLSVKSQSPLAFSAVYGLVAALLSVPFIFIEPWHFGSITSSVLFTTFLATLAFGAFEATQFFARKSLEASRFTIMFQITPAVTFLTSVALLQESITLPKITALGLIVGGNIVAMYKHGGQITRHGLLFALTAVTALGLAYVADKAVFMQYPLGLYMVISYFFPAFYVLLLALSRGDSIKQLGKEVQLASWKLPLLAIVSVLGYYLVLRTFQVAEASVAIPIVFTSTILTALGGITLLKERGNIAQKLIGALAVFAGVWLIRQ